jgi:hypothetical protein
MITDEDYKDFQEVKMWRKQTGRKYFMLGLIHGIRETYAVNILV